MSTPTTAVERYQPVLTEVERTTLLGFLAGYRSCTRDATRWICVSSPLGAGSTTAACSTSAASTSNTSPVTSRTAARRARRSPVDCARSSVFTARTKEGVIEHSPAVHNRRPRVDYKPHVAHRSPHIASRLHHHRRPRGHQPRTIADSYRSVESAPGSATLAEPTCRPRSRCRFPTSSRICWRFRSFMAGVVDETCEAGESPR